VACISKLPQRACISKEKPKDILKTLAEEFKIKEEIEGITGIPLRLLRKRSGILIACIVRNNHVIIPYGNDEIRSGDTVIVATAQGQMKNIKDILRV
jgi:trk system potassium uptake protein TrkA